MTNVGEGASLATKQRGVCKSVKVHCISSASWLLRSQLGRREGTATFVSVQPTSGAARTMCSDRQCSGNQTAGVYKRYTAVDVPKHFVRRCALGLRRCIRIELGELLFQILKLENLSKAGIYS